MGSDGLPIEYYKTFIHVLAPFLLYVYKEILLEKKLHLSVRRGIITLMEKIGRNPSYLSNWHPLSLLNTDYKILAILLSIRLNTVLPDIIHPMQSGFMKNRPIADNVATLINVVEHC